VVLLYLGFTGDTYFRDHFKDADHWQRVMGAYIHGVIPEGLPGVTVSTNRGGSFTMLVESIPVQLLQSPQSDSRTSIVPDQVAHPSKQKTMAKAKQVGTMESVESCSERRNPEPIAELSPAWVSFFEEALRLAELVRQRRAARESTIQSPSDESASP
jgi:hypothetical protein